MEYLLYKLAPKGEHGETVSKPAAPGKYTTFSPFDLHWSARMYQAGGTEFIKMVIMAVWSVASGVAARADIKIWAYVGQDGRILHSSVVTPTAMHMPWLPQDEAGNEIGGCFTVPDARGKRIYPYILQQVVSWAGIGRPLYMIVETGNAASRAGMEHGGFEAAGNVHRRSRWGRPPIYLRRKDE